MVTFKAPQAGTIQRAAPINPITAIGKSIVGVFIGIVLILLLAPVVLWFAESQNTAKVFSFSEEVSSTSRARGYIRTMDIAKADSPIACYENKVEGNCLYYDYNLEELQYEVKDYCGKLQKDQQVIEEKGQKCHLDSNNEEKCEQCYLVNESNWNVVEQVTKFQSFSIGNFKVSYPSKAKVIGAEEYSKQIDATHKESMEYLKDNTQILVAGSSDGTTISDGGNKKFLLVSSMDYEATYDALKAQDRFIAWLLRATAFILLVLGYKMIFGPISVMSNFVRKIPFLGKWIDNAADFIILLVSLLLALVHFILLWVLILLLKNIVIIAIVIAVGLGLFYLYTRFKKPPQQVLSGIVVIAIIGLALFSGNYQFQQEDVTGHVTFATLEKETKITGTIKAKLVVKDTDGDGLSDSKERSLGTDSNDADTDDDGLTDGEEVNTYASDPLSGDGDNDGFLDYNEVYKYSTDPDDEEDHPYIVFATATDGHIYALNAIDGYVLWTATTTASSASTYYSITFSSPTVANGIVYFGANDNYVYALDVEDGSEIWSYAGADTFSSPTVVDGVLYIGSGDNYIYALDADTGSELWSFETGDYILGKPTVYNDVVYIGSYDHYLYALDADDGSELWRFEAASKLLSTPAVAISTPTVGGLPVTEIYIISMASTDNDGYLYAINADDGTELWSQSVGGGQMTQSAVVDNGYVYFGTYDKYIHALDINSKSEVWTYNTALQVSNTPIIKDGVLYIGDDGGFVYALNSIDGSRVWVSLTNSESKVKYAPQVLGSMVYVNLYNHELIFALDRTGGGVQWYFRTGDSMLSGLAVY